MNSHILVGEQLIGKYVLLRRNHHWLAFGSAYIVKAVRGDVLETEREQLIYLDRWGRRAYSGRGKRYPGCSLAISAVACICDSADEVNSVIQLDVDAHAEFLLLIAKTKSRVHALATGYPIGVDDCLEGTVLHSEDTTAVRTDAQWSVTR